ncbi:hypothetical protein PGTUg99_034755 [Puccinia graminis f. sp. tritici]|uniref:Uncharacterized protein n=1 Tax=Puccinia graminis f. sp. tritici TaxID=56615 RepID=A0A5B0SEI2_PUCGR|nr:hypothetical protein PGTUg99_034755 [Puccinia graminis f. sp. tritici]
MRMINEDGRGDNSFYTTSKSIFFELTVSLKTVQDWHSQNNQKGQGGTVLEKTLARAARRKKRQVTKGSLAEDGDKLNQAV